MDSSHLGYRLSPLEGEPPGDPEFTRTTGIAGVEAVMRVVQTSPASGGQMYRGKLPLEPALACALNVGSVALSLGSPATSEGQQPP